MAKRRKEKDEEDEDKSFKMPKFNEEAFLKRERRNIKITVITFLFGCLMALICFGFWALLSESELRWPLVLMVGIFNASFLRYILLRLNFDLSEFTRKNWFISYAVYFFVWLIVLIVLVNPPFYDDEAPLIGLSILPGMQEPGGDILIVAKITDNVGVNKNDIVMEITDPNDNVTTLAPVGYEFDGIIIKYVYDNPENLLGEFNYKITATDKNGIPKTRPGSFSYDTNAIKITSPPLSFFENITSGVDIKIEVDEEVSPESFRVYYTLDDGDEINVNRRNKNEKDEYETSPGYKGWEPNSNYTMKVFVQTRHYFTNFNMEFNNTIMDTTQYNFTTANDFGIGDEIPPMPWNWSKLPKDQADELLNFDDVDKNNNNVIDPEELNDKNILPHPKYIGAPGFEIIIFIAALLVVVLIFKYKKKDRRN